MNKPSIRKLFLAETRSPLALHLTEIYLHINSNYYRRIYMTTVAGLQSTEALLLKPQWGR